MANIRPLIKELQEIACRELNEVPERLTKDLNDFKVWIEKQPHLKIRMDDQFLIGFLRGTKYSLEKAKHKIDRYYCLRTKYPDFYTIENIKDPKVMELVKLGVGLALPMPLNGLGPRLLYIRSAHFPTDKFTFADIMCLGNALQEISIIEDDYFVICGYIQILDMSDFSAAHMLQMTPTVIKKMSIFAEEAVPLRLKAIHVINTPAAFEKVFSMLKPLMPQKQRDRMFVHGSNLASLHEYIPQKYLPKEMGGENSSLDEITKSLAKNFSKHENYFLEDHKYRVEESLRVEKMPDFDDVFGIEGSFRKLNVD